MRIVEWDRLDAAGRTQLLARPRLETGAELRTRVARIIRAVRAGGDRALAEYTRRFDGAQPDSLWAETAGYPVLDPALETAIDTAIATVRAFHDPGRPRDYRLETAPGVTCRNRCLPLDPVGLYVPAGSAPLPSTAIMLAVPARIAGCRRIVLATPPGADGRADPAVLAVAARLGIERVLIAGGAQAIATMAYGTETVPACVKLFGPGNRFVAEAKRQVAEDPDGAAMDLPAGPSEVLVIADDSADAELVAMDLLSQAEHGPDSQVFLVTDSRKLAEAVDRWLERQTAALPQGETARTALAHGALIVAADPDRALEISERYAPEHLIINTRDGEALANRVRAAGSVFVGPWTPEALGDYVTGANHTLPTGGWARSASGLSVADFMRRMSVQSATADGLRNLGPAGARLAAHEGLDAHRLAIELRLERLV